MKLVTAEEMRELDQLASSQYGIPGIVLMENAGLRVLDAVLEILEGEVAGKRVLVFAGKGNNGGDGFVVARHLANKRAEVKVFLLGRPEDVRGDARVNLDILEQMGVKIYPLQAEKDLQRVDIALLHADVLVDAIYGTGFKGAAMGTIAQVIRQINSAHRPLVAVDLPSGLEANTGKVYGPCVQATRTVTFGLPKLGLYLEPGARYAGDVTVADISLPARLVSGRPLKRELLTPSWCSAQLPRREPSAHKGSFGRVLVVGGSEGMTGAVTLSAQAALRSGAGLVTAAVPRSLHPVLETKTTEVMTSPLPETDARSFSMEAVAPVLELARDATVVALGMGIGRHPATVEWVRRLLPQLKVPVVIDADGLNALAGATGLFPSLGVPVVITPHPGEMARLLDVAAARVQEDRLKGAEQAAKDWGVTVVLKGAKTVVASPGGETFLNPTGNPGMATGGSGDVLTGVIAGLMAQGLAAPVAAAVGVFVHGAAGDLAARSKGHRGLIAGDILEMLPTIWRDLEVGPED
ncbi:carbohydrate kinase [Clostridiales bacterium PH28_bin88]|nr:carbohydrate kinase [Clostridiales bacterium PH28_bin88]